MNRQRHIFVPAVIGLLLLVAGCADNASGQAADQQPVATSQISVQDNSFGPAVVEVAAGDTVTWTWEGDNDHNVVGDGFESDVQSAGTFEQQFAEPGEYPFQCTLHGGMNGTVVVTAAGGDASSEDA